MLATTRLACTLLFERQLRYDFRSCLRNNIRKSFSSKACPPPPKDPKYQDILIGEHEFSEKEGTTKDRLELRSRVLAETLECDQKELRDILKFYPDVILQPLNRLVWNARILKMRYSVESILKYPSVLRLSWRTVESRRRIFEEIKAQTRKDMGALVLFNEFLGQTIFELSRRQIITIKDLLPAIISKIEDCPPNLHKELASELSHPASLALTLREYRRLIVRAYLTNRLGKFTLPKHVLTKLDTQSMDLISARMNILLKELGLKPQFLITRSELLLVNAHNLQSVLELREHLNDVPLRKIVEQNSKVPCMSAKRLCDVETILRSYSVRPKCSARFPWIYNVDPNSFVGCEENETLIDEQGPLRRMHYKDIVEGISRIAQKTKEQTEPESNSDGNNQRNHSCSVLDYLATRLGADSSQKDEMRRAMKRHPLKKYSRLSQTAESCDFLLDEGIMTEAQILRCSSICFWDKRTIREVWNSFPKEFYMEALGPKWQEHPFLAEMLVYEAENLGISLLPKWRKEDESKEKTTGELVEKSTLDEEDHIEEENDHFEETTTVFGMSVSDRT